MGIPEKLKKLAELINKLPGIGPKMSERLAYHIFQMDISEVRELVEAIESVKDKLNLCSECFLPTENKLCKICSDASRDRTVICVVKNVSSVNAIERTGKFSGVYLVLDKILSPLDGTSPEKGRIEKLLERISGGVKEVIVATDTDTEGELTANYIAQTIKTAGLKITRLGYGMPVGGSLEYADEITLSRSLEGRKEI